MINTILLRFLFNWKDLKLYFLFYVFKLFLKIKKNQVKIYILFFIVIVSLKGSKTKALFFVLFCKIIFTTDILLFEIYIFASLVF